MKQLICLLIALSLLCTQAQSKVVKLGRNIHATTAYQTLSTVGLADIAKECDPNCLDCDKDTGTCLKCTSNRYVSGKFCLICPEMTYCDGEKVIPNCSGVSCLGNSVAQATDTGCCCVKK